MHLPGKTIEHTVVLSNTTLQIYGDKCPKNLELLEMKNHLAEKHFTKLPMFGASSSTREVREGHLASRTFEVITVKSCLGDVEVELFFDASSANEEQSTWKKYIEEAIDNSTTQLTALTLAKHQLGQRSRPPQLKRQKSFQKS